MLQPKLLRTCAQYQYTERNRDKQTDKLVAIVHFLALAALNHNGREDFQERTVNISLLVVDAASAVASCPARALVKALKDRVFGSRRDMNEDTASPNVASG